MAPGNAIARFTKLASDLLVGRKIKSARYLDSEESLELMWNESGIVLELDNGSLVLLQCDDEGNGPGALAVISTDENEEWNILPTLPI